MSSEKWDRSVVYDNIHSLVKWRRLQKLLEENSWTVDRISGSHYIFVKPGHRCIPLAFHGGSVTRRYAMMVLRQAQILTTDDDSDNLLGSEVDNTEISGTTNGEEQGEEIWAQPIPEPKPLASITEIDKDILRTKHEEKKKKDRNEMLRRSELLERVQCDVADGKFESAIKSIEEEGIHFVGSSDVEFEFSSNLIFFKLVALTECAFHEHSFNSKEQHKAIIDTLDLASQFMEAVCERRQEGRSLALALQERVIKVYLDGARCAFEKYMRVVLPPDGIKMLLFPSTDEKVITSQEFVYAQLDTMLDCLNFMVRMYKFVENQPFRPVHAMNIMEKLYAANLFSPCIGRMLVLFDMEEFDAATEAAKSLLFIAERFDEVHIDSLFGFRLMPRCAMITSQHVIGIATHVLALVQAYRFAKKELIWSRFAGVMARNTEKESNRRFESRNFDVGGAIAFTDMVLRAIQGSRQHLEDLVVSNMTRQFMLDTLFDPIFILFHLATHLLEKSSIRKKAMKLLKSKSLQKSREFRKSQYDQLRRDILLFLDRLQKLSAIYAIYDGHLDEKARWDNGEMAIHLLNSARFNLVLLFSVLFDEFSHSLLVIHRSLAVLLNDLDMARHFNVDLLRKLRGECETGAEVLGTGRWSFDLVFCSSIPLFLGDYTIKSEFNQLLVIDGLGFDQLKTLFFKEEHLRELKLDETLSAGSIAFTLLSHLLDLGRTPISEPFVRKILNDLGRDSSKSAVFRRRLKNEAKRFTKMIEKLSKNATDQREKLRRCLASREAAVNLLLGILKECVLKRRRIPESVMERINSERLSRREEVVLVTEHSNCIRAWSYKDTEDISRSMIELQDAAETATSFLHHATAQQYPIAKSISNQSWTQKDASTRLDKLPRDALNAVADVACLCDIIQLAR